MVRMRVRARMRVRVSEDVREVGVLLLVGCDPYRHARTQAEMSELERQAAVRAVTARNVRRKEASAGPSAASLPTA